jgi:farnesol dehydrogenase
MSGATHVCHLAAMVTSSSSDLDILYDVNVGGTVNIMDAAVRQGIEAIVHVSSTSAIEFADAGVADERSIVPRTRNLTEYGRSKALAELEVERHPANGLRSVIVYPTRVFGIGPLEDCNAATRILDLYLRGRLPILPGGGRLFANWAYVDDVAGGIVLALLRGRASQRYILGGENATLREFLTLAASLAGCVRHAIPLPLVIGRVISVLEETRAKLQGNRARITSAWYNSITEETQLSCAKAQNDLGYRITPLEQALVRVVRWLAAERKKK